MKHYIGIDNSSSDHKIKIIDEEGKKMLDIVGVCAN